MNYLLQLVVKIWSVEFEGDFVCIKRHACTKLILRACSFNSSGILIEIVTHMNILRVRVRYLKVSKQHERIQNLSRDAFSYTIAYLILPAYKTELCHQF